MSSFYIDAATAVAVLSAAIWLYLLFGRGFFWLERPRPAPPAPPRRPEIVAIIPARDEAGTIGETVTSLLRQDYAGRLAIVLVDDHSSDGTATVAQAAARAAGDADRLTIVAARQLPAGWAGKMWAVAEGLRHLETSGGTAELVLLTDADIAHHPGNLPGLVARIERDGLDLASLMVRLNCETFAERALIPAFVFFFAMLYPFAWVNDPRRRVAGAAGGCPSPPPPGRRLHAGLAQRARAHRRRRQRARRADRRLRARRRNQAGRQDLARPRRGDAKLAPLRGARRYLADDRAHRL
jgi:hopene-associated glycosyltransferase HpnB